MTHTATSSDEYRGELRGSQVAELLKRAERMEQDALTALVSRANPYEALAKANEAAGIRTALTFLVEKK